MSDFLHCEFCDTRTRKARKSHGCSECAGRIEVGEVYTVIVGKWQDFGFESYYQCADCAELAESARKWDAYEDGPALGELSNWLGEMNGGEGIAELQARFDAIRVKRGKDPMFPPDEVSE